MKFKRLLFIVVIPILLAYTGICFYLYQTQEKMLFRPTTLSADYIHSYDEPFDELNYTMDDGAVLNAIWFKDSTRNKLVYFLHGNGGNITVAIEHGDLDIYLKNGFDVVYIDYRTYGKSTGELSEANIFSDVNTIYQNLKKDYVEDSIVVYGKSMGSGFATYVASQNKPGMLILETPYYSMLDLASNDMPAMPVSWVLRYPIRTDLFIKDVSCPTHLLHGTSDNTIYYNSSVKLFELCPEGSSLTTIEGGGHNGLNKFNDQLREKINALLADF